MKAAGPLTEAAVRADIEAHPPVMDAAEREGIALALIAKANLPDLFPDPDDLAQATATVTLRTNVPSEGQLAFDDQVVSVKRSARWHAEELLALFHELAEDALRPYRHSHGDVWLCALALAIPRDVLDLVGFYRQRIPEWAVALREEAYADAARAA